MTFILKEGLVHIVGNHGLANNTIEGAVETPELSSDFTLELSVNNGPYHTVAGHIKLNEQELKKTTLQLVFRATRQKKTIYYKSDIIPLTHAIILGKNLEDSYPEVIKLLLKRMADVEAFVGMEMKGTKDELHKNMLDIVDTFEEINRKGSLF